MLNSSTRGAQKGFGGQEHQFATRTAHFATQYRSLIQYASICGMKMSEISHEPR
jgi:hypothetical protein